MNYLLLGLSLGFSAGVSPGPLLALVMQRSLKGGLGSGVRVALAPLVSDLPIVVLSLLVVGQLPDRALDVILAVGALFVIWLGIDGLRHAGKAPAAEETTTASKDVLHGALVNVLSPHPYIFWATVGAPTTILAWRAAHIDAVAFVFGFYAMLIGSKVLMAFLFSRAQGLPAQWHIRLLRGASALLVLAGLAMLGAALRSLVTLL